MMITHIVMFTFKDDNKESNINQAKEMLNSLIDKVPTLLSMEVGVNFSSEARAMDLSIITTFKDSLGLDAYAVHPKHLEVVSFIKEVVSSSKVVDYKVE